MYFDCSSGSVGFMTAFAALSANNFSAVLLLRNDVGLPVSTVRLMNELPALKPTSIDFSMLSKSTKIWRLLTSSAVIWQSIAEAGGSSGIGSGIAIKIYRL